jgi:hypothetical protein
LSGTSGRDGCDTDGNQSRSFFNEEVAIGAILWSLDRMGVGKKPRERPLDEFEGDEPEEIM